MATAAPQIFLQYNDDSGDPLASGTLTAYTAGTTNLKDIYSDAAGTVADNPIALDSGGRVDIYLGTGTYDFLIKNSAGETEDTKDNVSSAGSDSSTSVVDNIAALRALASGAFDYVSTAGYTTVGDGGHSTYRWSSTSTAADDNGLVIQPDSSPATGRWLLQNNGFINDLQLNSSGDLEIQPVSADQSVIISGGTSTGSVTLDSTSGNVIINPTGATVIKDTSTTVLYIDSTGATFSVGSTMGSVNGSFVPKVVTQDAEPTSGSGASDLALGEACFWIDSNDSNRLYLLYNQATTIKKIELT